MADPLNPPLQFTPRPGSEPEPEPARPKRKRPAAAAPGLAGPFGGGSFIAPPIPPDAIVRMQPPAPAPAPAAIDPYMGILIVAGIFLLVMFSKMGD